MEAEEQKLRPRKAGVVPARAVRARDRVPPEPRSDVCLPLDERRRTKAALSDNVLIPRSDGRSREPSRSIAWRAGCGRSACPVREGEWRMGSPLLPHRLKASLPWPVKRSARAASLRAPYTPCAPSKPLSGDGLTLALINTPLSSPFICPAFLHHYNWHSTSRRSQTPFPTSKLNLTMNNLFELHT